MDADGSAARREGSDDKPFDLTPRRNVRSTIVRGVAVAAVLVVMSAIAGAVWLRRQFADIPTFAESAPGWVAPADTLPSGAVDITSEMMPGVSSGSPSTTAPPDVIKGIDGPTIPPPPPPGERGVAFLVFSTGSSQLTASDAERLHIPPDRAAMSDNLTDTIMVVIAYPKTGKVGVLSIPRDLYIPQLRDRINTIYVRLGPRALAQTVSRMTGLPIDHMVAINFSAFGELTDAVGGVEVWVDGPARDTNTGFEASQSGCMHLDGAKALALARSRHWEVQTAAGWQLDGSADDFGRIRRQQLLVRSALRKLATPTGLASIGAVTGVAQRTLIVDRDLDFGAMSGLGLDMLRAPETEIRSYSYRGTPGWAGPASVVFTDARANGAQLAALQRLLRGDRIDDREGGDPAPPKAGPC